MITYVKGDLLAGFIRDDINVLVHGCNCYCKMGGGIAKAIRDEFPEAYETDLSYDKKFDNKADKLGTFSFTTVERHKHLDYLGKPIFKSYWSKGYIINAYTQDTYWDRKRMLSYDAIRTIMRTLNERIHPTYKIGMPLIGCGLAHGDWKIVSQILNEEFLDREIFVYYLEGAEKVIGETL